MLEQPEQLVLQEKLAKLEPLEPQVKLVLKDLLDRVVYKVQLELLASLVLQELLVP